MSIPGTALALLHPRRLPTYWIYAFHQAKSLQEGLRQGFEEDDEEDSPSASGARKPALMCPVSGEIVRLRYPLPFLCSTSMVGARGRLGRVPLLNFQHLLVAPCRSASTANRLSPRRVGTGVHRQRRPLLRRLGAGEDRLEPGDRQRVDLLGAGPGAAPAPQSTGARGR